MHRILGSVFLIVFSTSAFAQETIGTLPARVYNPQNQCQPLICPVGSTFDGIQCYLDTNQHCTGGGVCRSDVGNHDVVLVVDCSPLAPAQKDPVM